METAGMHMRVEPHEVTSKSRGWLMALGIATMVLGAFALYWSVATTLISVLYIGWFFIIGGVFQIAYSFTAGRFSGFILHLLLGVLYVIAGFAVIMNPAAGAVSLTLFMSFFFLVSGVFRMVAAASVPFTGRGWAFLSGLITAALGIYVMANLRAATPFLLGTLVGIDMIFFGAYLTTFAVALKSILPTRSTHSRPAYP